MKKVVWIIEYIFKKVTRSNAFYATCSQRRVMRLSSAGHFNHRVHHLNACASKSLTLGFCKRLSADREALTVQSEF